MSLKKISSSKDGSVKGKSARAGAAVYIYEYYINNWSNILDPSFTDGSVQSAGAGGAIYIYLYDA